jgi:hypothetical protein
MPDSIGIPKGHNVLPTWAQIFFFFGDGILTVPRYKMRIAISSAFVSW